MGYRLRPSWIWQRKRLGTFELIIAIANDGVAGIPGVLRLLIESGDGKFQQSGSLDGGHPHGGKVRQASFMLPRGMGTGEIRLRAEVEGKGGVRRAVQWACAQPLNPDGSFTITLKRNDEAGWLKGV